MNLEKKPFGNNYDEIWQLLLKMHMRIYTNLRTCLLSEMNRVRIPFRDIEIIFELYSSLCFTASD